MDFNSYKIFLMQMSVVIDVKSMLTVVEAINSALDLQLTIMETVCFTMN